MAITARLLLVTLLLARPDGKDQDALVGKQAAGRVGFFLHVEDFDIAGNKWDLIGPAPEISAVR